MSCLSLIWEKVLHFVLTRTKEDTYTIDRKQRKTSEFKTIKLLIEY